MEEHKRVLVAVALFGVELSACCESCIFGASDQFAPSPRISTLHSPDTSSLHFVSITHMFSDIQECRAATLEYCCALTSAICFHLTNTFVASFDLYPTIHDARFLYWKSASPGISQEKQCRLLIPALLSCFIILSCRKDCSHAACSTMKVVKDDGIDHHHEKVSLCSGLTGRGNCPLVLLHEIRSLVSGCCIPLHLTSGPCVDFFFPVASLLLALRT